MAGNVDGHNDTDLEMLLQVKHSSEQLSMEGPSFVSPNGSFEQVSHSGRVVQGSSALNNL